MALQPPKGADGEPLKDGERFDLAFSDGRNGLPWTC